MLCDRSVHSSGFPRRSRVIWVFAAAWIVAVVAGFLVLWA
jgi:hypothetical protein